MDIVQCSTGTERKFIAKIRLGVLNLRISTGRYEVPRLLPKDRLCKNCNINIIYNNSNDDIENDQYCETERHFVLYCSKHDQLRQELFSKCSIPGFESFSDYDKFRYLLTNPSVAKIFANFVIKAMHNRNQT